MKKLLIAVFFVSLSGCSVIDAYFMAHYDNNEYGLVNDIRASSYLAQEECGDYTKSVQNVKRIYETSYRFQGFATFTPRNEDTTKLSEKLFTLAKGTKEYYDTHDKVSELFCKSKLQQINKSAEEIQAVIARKPR